MLYLLIMIIPVVRKSLLKYFRQTKCPQFLLSNDSEENTIYKPDRYQMINNKIFKSVNKGEYGRSILVKPFHQVEIIS